MKGILGPDGYPVQFTNFYGDTHQRRMDVPGLPGGQGIFFRTHTPNVGVKLSLENGKLVGASSELIPCYVHTGGRVNNYCPAPIEDEEQARRGLDFMDGRAKLPL